MAATDYPFLHPVFLNMALVLIALIAIVPCMCSGDTTSFILDSKRWVYCIIHVKLDAQKWISKDQFLYSCFFFYFNLSRFPDDDRFAPPIGNGYLATNVFSDAIYVDGVFNGYREDSHRARIPSTASIRVTSEVISDVYRLDMRNGMYLPENQIFLHKIY